MGKKVKSGEDVTGNRAVATRKIPGRITPRHTSGKAERGLLTATGGCPPSWKAYGVLMVLDADGTIRYVSPSVKGMLGTSPLELRGKKALDFFDRIDPDEVERVAAAFEGFCRHPGATDMWSCGLEAPTVYGSTWK
ncbi:MAG: PAS domain-containing protein [Actinomycetota bacterium]|nr:PAS domain-containing protein [Actinomycetota bacterium]